MKREFQLQGHPLVLMRPRIVPPYGWVGHIPFAYLAIDLLRPRNLVELGTHSGNSYMAFCQAATALALDCRFTAIDNWRGDEHAQHYGEQVYAALKSRHDPLYGKFSRLLRSRFDDALQEFGDGTIDLLHIDGLHTYEAVRHDFETWLPKLSDRAVVLLHDTEVRDRNFGVAQFFEELSKRYPCFGFRHNSGLGVVMVGANVSESFQDFFRSAEQGPQAMRGFFEALAGTLVDADDQPVSGAGMEPNAVFCHLFYRGEDQVFDESRMVSQEVDLTDRVVDLRFHLPAGVQAHYLRVDPADLPGIYGLGCVTLGRDGQGSQLSVASLSQRLGHISGELLPTSSLDMVRLSSFDNDPHLEFEVGSLLGEAKADQRLEVGVRVEYEVVLQEPVLQRIMERSALSLSTMRELSRERIDSQSLVRAFFQQQIQLQSFAEKIAGKSDVRQLIADLEQSRVSQAASLQNVEARLDQSDANTIGAIRQLNALIERSGQENSQALRQLQQSINELAGRGVWSRIKRRLRATR